MTLPKFVFRPRPPAIPAIPDAKHVEKEPENSRIAKIAGGHPPKREIDGDRLLRLLDAGNWYPRIDHEGKVDLATHGGRKMPERLSSDLKEHRREFVATLIQRTESDVEALREILKGGPVLIDEARRRFLATGRSESRYNGACVHLPAATIPHEAEEPGRARGELWRISIGGRQ